MPGREKHYWENLNGTRLACEKSNNNIWEKSSGGEVGEILGGKNSSGRDNGKYPDLVSAGRGGGREKNTFGEEGKAEWPGLEKRSLATKKLDESGV